MKGGEAGGVQGCRTRPTPTLNPHFPAHTWFCSRLRRAAGLGAGLAASGGGMAASAGGMGAASAQTNFKIGLAEDPDVLDPSLARSYVGRIVFASLCDKLFD